MSDQVTCPECGKAMPEGNAHGLCPACLMGQAMASRTFDTRSGGEPLPPPPTPEEIADRFPQFEVVECLGRGGMGVVYKARQKSLDRWVAIKVLAPERVDDERFAEHFEREAKTLARMSHPNIVTVFDHGETGGLFYIVMEYVDGVNLRDLLREGKMEPEQALAIVPPVCEALEYAHGKGVVHRDIKPENLLLDREGRVKIADFGIASLVGAGGELSGTPPYMAPEQEDGRVDRRADIYALGVVLYEMLTGERPTRDVVAPSRKVQVDVKIDEMVLRALEKEPERRYQTADEFRTVVETMATASSDPDRDPGPEARRQEAQRGSTRGGAGGGAISLHGAVIGVAWLLLALGVFVSGRAIREAGSEWNGELPALTQLLVTMGTGPLVWALLTMLLPLAGLGTWLLGRFGGRVALWVGSLLSGTVIAGLSALVVVGLSIAPVDVAANGLAALAAPLWLGLGLLGAGFASLRNVPRPADNLARWALGLLVGAVFGAPLLFALVPGGRHEWVLAFGVLCALGSFGCALASWGTKLGRGLLIGWLGIAVPTPLLLATVWMMNRAHAEEELARRALRMEEAKALAGEMERASLTNRLVGTWQLDVRRGPKARLNFEPDGAWSSSVEVLGDVFEAGGKWWLEHDGLHMRKEFSPKAAEIGGEEVFEIAELDESHLVMTRIGDDGKPKTDRFRRIGGESPVESAPPAQAGETTADAFVGRWRWIEEGTGDTILLTVEPGGLATMEGSDTGSGREFHRQCEWQRVGSELKLAMPDGAASGQRLPDGSLELNGPDGPKMLFRRIFGKVSDEEPEPMDVLRPENVGVWRYEGSGERFWYALGPDGRLRVRGEDEGGLLEGEGTWAATDDGVRMKFEYRTLDGVRLVRPMSEELTPRRVSGGEIAWSPGPGTSERRIRKVSDDPQAQPWLQAEPDSKAGGPRTATMSVEVSGSVARPGTYLLPEGSTVLDALAMAGGWTGGVDAWLVRGGDSPDGSGDHRHRHELRAILDGRENTPGVFPGMVLSIEPKND